MIDMSGKCGAELSTALAEIKSLTTCEEVRTARMMRSVSDLLDGKLRELRRQQREGQALIEQGITLDELKQILKTFGGQYVEDF